MQEKEKKAKIKYWLEVSGMGRKELAQKINVSENALNGWLSTKDIPPARWQEIKAIFEPDEPPETEEVDILDLSTIRPITILYSKNKHSKLEDIAIKKGFKSINDLLTFLDDKLLDEQ